MNAEEIAAALGGHRAGNCWMARCPAHDDSTPSLAIAETKDGKTLVRCHAGCNQRTVIEALRDRGLWATLRHPGHQMRSQMPPAPSAHDGESAKRRTARALQIWSATRPASGTLAEVYLQVRGITIAPPSSLRFHPALKHPNGQTLPALVGLVTSGARNAAAGIHLTFLARDGRGKAPVSANKLMLGPCRGVVRRCAAAAVPEPLAGGSSRPRRRRARPDAAAGRRG